MQFLKRLKLYPLTLHKKGKLAMATARALAQDYLELARKNRNDARSILSTSEKWDDAYLAICAIKDAKRNIDCARCLRLHGDDYYNIPG